MAVMAALALTAVIAALFAVDGKNEADRQTARAVSARLSTEANAVRSSDPALAALLALTARQAADTTEARSALIGSSAPPYATRYVTGGLTEVTAWDSSPDGRLLAEGTTQDTLRVWNAEGPRQQPPLILHAPLGTVTTAPACRRRGQGTGTAVGPAQHPPTDPSARPER